MEVQQTNVSSEQALDCEHDQPRSPRPSNFGLSVSHLLYSRIGGLRNNFFDILDPAMNDVAESIQKSSLP
jgi:hypothetical protein